MAIRPTTSLDAGRGLFGPQNRETPGGGRSGDWISAHCDGGARGNPGPAGYGALIQGPDGAVIAELSEFLGLKTNNFAEYSGLLGCLQYALDHGHRRLRMVSDSELMVKQIQGKYQVKSPDLKPLYEEAKRRIAKLDGFEISHALRHKNKDADRLANEAMDRGMKGGSMSRSGSSGSSRAAANAAPFPSRAAAPPVPISSRPAQPPIAKADVMLRGFTRDGVVHVLGGEKLPDGVFVKIIRE
jgi:probable phosphoglycerate mutase